MGNTTIKKSAAELIILKNNAYVIEQYVLIKHPYVEIRNTLTNISKKHLLEREKLPSWIKCEYTGLVKYPFTKNTKTTSIIPVGLLKYAIKNNIITREQVANWAKKEYIKATQLDNIIFNSQHIRNKLKASFGNIYNY
jgi:hypothetical protein